MLGRVELTNKLVAEKLGIDEREVCKVMSFTYQELATELQECTYPYLYVRNLGTFVLRKRAVNRRLYVLTRARKANKGRVKNERNDKTIKTIETEMFRLFDIRRMLRKYIKPSNGKNTNDIKG